MASKSNVLAALAVVVVLAAVGQMPRGAEGANISGIVPCSIGSLINVTQVPPFPNAGVQAVCNTTVVASATAGINGMFTIFEGIPPFLPSIIVPLVANQCRVAVTTPLAACNTSLAGATGALTAPLQLFNTTAGGAGPVGNITTAGGIVGALAGIASGVLRIAPGLFSFV